jgi:phenylacetate-CoA ligase
MFPIVVKHALYPLHEALLRRPTFRQVADLERTQWMSRARIESLQLERLTLLLRTAAAHSPWHAQRMAEAGIDPDADLTWDAFRRLPTMTRADARENRDRIAWLGVPGGAMPYNTGGSSGQPLSFYFGRARQASDASGRIRARRWWGVDVGAREVYLWGAPVELNRTDRTKQLRDRAFNQLLLNAFEMNPARMDRYLDTIERFEPECIYGYASSIALLAAHAEGRSRRARLRRLRVVCTTGEPLYQYQRELIGRVFQAPVANEFGSRDIGFTAHETPAGQLLLLSEHVILESLDAQGRPVPEGETGEAVLTGLCSEAQPFIRYRTGDMVRIGAGTCREGRGLHVIEEVAGRTTDFVVRADGAVMHALAVIYVLRAISGIQEFKVIQHELDRVEVLVVPDARWTPAAVEQIRQGLQARLGAAVRIETRVTDRIEPEASGKHRYVVSCVTAPVVAELNRAAAAKPVSRPAMRERAH